MSDSEFHYVRIGGADGGVDAVDGRAIGVDLETILKDGLPPFRVALEIIAALCEILDIADQDGEAHGDVHPRNVFLDDTGAISIEGFGLAPEQIWAPEGELLGPITDLYGLGYTAYRLLATRDLTDLPDDPDGHDDAVIDAVIALPWGDMPEEWVGDIQWFLAKLMSFEPEQRPTAVDAWRSFIAFATDAEGMELIDWAPDAIEGGGDRRDAALAVRPAPEEADEDLGGPVVKKAGIQKGAISFGGGAAKGGQATAFWSKEQMKAALDSENQDDDDDAPVEDAPAFKPKAAQATSFWTRDQMEAMARGESDAPRPKRKESATPRQAAPDAPAPAAPPPPPASPKAPSSPPPVAPPPVSNPPPVAGGPVAGGPVAAAPGIASGPGADDTYHDEDEGGGGKTGLIIAAVIVVLILLCGGAGAIGGAVYFLSGSTDTASSSSSSSSSADRDEAPPSGGADTAIEEVEPTEPLPSDEPETEPEPEPEPEAKPEPKPTPKPAPTRSSTRSSTSGSSSSRSGSRSGSSSGARSGSRSAAAAPTGPTRIVFTVPGSGTMRCGDGSSSSMDGRGSITFTNLTADGETCSFIAGGKPVCAGFIEQGNRKCVCDADSQMITCQ